MDTYSNAPDFGEQPVRRPFIPKPPECMELGCNKPPTCTATILIGYDPERGAVPGNGRLVNWRFCDEDAEAIKQELLLAATDSTELVCIIPDSLPVV